MMSPTPGSWSIPGTEYVPLRSGPNTGSKKFTLQSAPVLLVLVALQTQTSSKMRFKGNVCRSKNTIQRRSEL